MVVTLKGNRRPSEHVWLWRLAWHPKGFEIIPWTALSDFYEKTIALYDRQFGVLRSIILVMVLLSVANSVNMSPVRADSSSVPCWRWEPIPDVFLLILTEKAPLRAYSAL